MKPRFLYLLGFIALGACSGTVRTLPILSDEYEVSVNAPAGMYGGFIGLSASQSLLEKKAAELCPGGYTKVGEDKDQGMLATPFIRWDILCKTSSPS